MSNHPSIGRQITWRLAGLFTCALLLSSAIFLYESWIHRVDNLDRSLHGAATRIADAIEPTPGGALRISGAALTSLEATEIPSLRYAAVDPATGVVAEGSMPELLHALAPTRGGAPAVGGFNFADAAGQSQRGYVLLSPRPPEYLRIAVASPNLSLGDTLAWMQDETLSELLPILAPLFLGALLIAPLTIRRSLLPLDRLSAQAALIRPERTDVRFNEEGIPVEILPLVHKINEALARIDEGFEQQRRFTSNAAHELRTPLAILRARIDGLGDSPAKQGLIRDVERMSRLVSQLLLAGRQEMQPPASEAKVDLAAVARETVERLQLLPAARDHELRLALPEDPVTLRGDAESLGDALRNLIDNAIAYSPAGRPVDIEVTPDGAVEVRDRGAGIPVEDREQIFERFWRGRRAAGDGAGLGLSIVKAIVAQHGGAIAIRDNPEGGTIFRMQFPRAGP